MFRLQNLPVYKSIIFSHNILTNHTFDFQNSIIFAFIHDRDKHRITESCFITHFDAIIQRQGFYKISHSLSKMMLKISTCIYDTSPFRGCPRGIMVKAMDCGIVVREFELQSCYYVHFRTNTLGKGMNSLILPAMG